MQLEQLGPYKIGRSLGRGGMGTVYAGMQIETNGPAAIKILSATLAHDDGFRERFKAEIETLRKLHHPNIVSLYGYGEQDEFLFYAMELVDGHSLEDDLQKGRKFTWREVTDYSIQICRALKHAHDRGVVHRDIKPANLLISPDGQIKLSDFGIAKLFGATGLTAVGGVLGTAEYMAPEQTDGRPITPRTDLYSLGGVMYTLLAGRPPFKAATVVEMLQLQRYAEPDPVRRYAPEVPEELQFIIADLLVKDPESRIATAMVLSRRLEAMRHGLSVRIDPSLNAQTLPAPQIPNVSVSSATMTAAGQPAAQPPQTEDSDSAEYDVSPPRVAPEEAHARAQRATAELTIAASHDAKTLDLPASEPAPQPAARFTTVSEEERQRFEPAARPEEGLLSLHTAMLAGAAVLLALATWYLMQPASADRLYSRIERAARPGDAESLEGAKADIDTFLAHYADDSRAGTVERYRDELKLQRASRDAERRARSTTEIESATPVDRAYLEAQNYIKLNPEIAEERLAALVDLYSGDEQLPAKDQESLELARQKLDVLRGQIRDRAAADLRLLDRRLDAADQLENTDPAAARAIRAGVVKLYADKPWASAAVDRAVAALAARTAAGTSSGP